MKKLTCVLLTLCLVFGLSMSAMAETYANITELMSYWEQEGYPDDVAGLYSTDGSAENLTILLVGDADHSRENEIRAMLEDDSTVSFGIGLYTQSQLQTIKAEIVEGFLSDEASGVYGCGVGWGNEGGFGTSGMELRVVVDVDEARVDEYTELFYQQYADAVVVEASEPPVAEEEGTLATELPEEADAVLDVDGNPVEPDEAAENPAQTSEAPAEDTAGEAAPTDSHAERIALIITLAVLLLVLIGVIVRGILRKKNTKK